MSRQSKEGFIQRFLNNPKPYPILAGVLAGIYPIFFYATNNYTLVNTFTHFVYFLITFIVLPALSLYILYTISKKVWDGKYANYVIPVLSSFLFFFLLNISIHGTIKKKISVVLLFISFAIGYFLWKHTKKIMLVQILFAIIGLVTFIPKLYNSFTYDYSWTHPTDDIKEVIFKKKPNIYFIQPDGYLNFSELNKGYYEVTNKDFENYLITNNFDVYPDFRSNYVSTLTSNSATFMMKHHYYNGKSNLESLHARDMIVSKNNAIDILKNNGYKTHLLIEKPYFLSNRPTMGYDYCNIDYSEFGYIGTGLRLYKDVLDSLVTTMQRDKEQPKFFFIEKFNPGHIQHNPSHSKGVKTEKENWLRQLDIANKELKILVDQIITNDPKAMIVLMADHGGFVGMHSTHDMYKKTQDRDLLYSIFSSNLAIHWPDGQKRHGENLKSAVNIFRVLFSYLSENKKYLKQTEDNGSYILIKEDAPKGVYQCINDAGEITFIKK